MSTPTIATSIGSPPDHERLLVWVEHIAELTAPEQIHWCDGSEEEHELLRERLVEAGTLVRRADAVRPNSYLARSDPADASSVEDRTFVCAARERDAGPMNNWRAPRRMRQTLSALFRGSMRGRTMYVVPFALGPSASDLCRVGVQLTDSAYVAGLLRTMTRMGRPALDALGEHGYFVPCVHSVGRPLLDGADDVPWPCDPENRCIAHFPNTRAVWSYGSGYAANALLSRRCVGLRIASVIARDEGWLAEHMLLLKLTSPEGTVKYVAGAFPSACGTTNLSRLIPTLPGWRVQTIGDDIAWMKFGPDGRLRAINPEAGFFGVAPGTGYHTNPNAMATIERDTIFTNTAKTDDGDVWWEGMTTEPPAHLIDWLGHHWTSDSETPAAHPNARFTAAAAQCPSIAPEWEDPAGVPIDAILFGGRRSGVVPLVREAFDWSHGVFFGATMSSETGATRGGTPGELRFDPFGMRDSCGYHMADYFAHWLRIGQQTDPGKLPKIFHVNWFRKDPETGRFLWPGYGENVRVLAWIFRRCEGRASARETPIGLTPDPTRLDLSGLDLSPERAERVLEVDEAELRAELPVLGDHLARFCGRLPTELRDEFRSLERRLERA